MPISHGSGYAGGCTATGGVVRRIEHPQERFDIFPHEKNRLKRCLKKIFQISKMLSTHIFSLTQLVKNHRR
jgi:hypothetical protein